MGVSFKPGRICAKQPLSVQQYNPRRSLFSSVLSSLIVFASRSFSRRLSLQLQHPFVVPSIGSSIACDSAISGRNLFCEYCEYKTFCEWITWIAPVAASIVDRGGELPAPRLLLVPQQRPFLGARVWCSTAPLPGCACEERGRLYSTSGVA